MCGRFAFYSPAEAVTRIFGVADVPEIEPRFNIAPTQYVPVVRADPQQQRRIEMLRWGLVPFWAKDISIGNRMINARAETVADKPAFRDSFRRRRCIVPANGFYEWKKHGSQKQPYFISLGGDTPFALAGLWASWRNKNDQDDKGDPQRLETFTIVTTSPSPKLSELHDRMPVILQQSDYARWLDPANDDADALKGLLQPYQSPELQFWPVSRDVNRPANDSPELVEKTVIS